MATYFHGNSEIGAAGGDGLQTLILMNPAFLGYSDAPPHQPPGNLLFLNSNNLTSAFHHAPPSSAQHFVGIPLHGAAANSASAQDPSPQQQQQQQQQDGFLPRLHCNLYNLPIDMGTAAAAARDATRSQQGGLSLSLSSQQHHGYVSFRSERDIPSAQPLPTTGASTAAAVSSEDVVRPQLGGSPSSASAVSNGPVNGVQSVLLNSKYLRAAQEILDEVVNVGKGAKTATESSSSKATPKIEHPKSSTDDTDAGAGAKRGSVELTTAERQEIQMKKAKLVNMLDEVEQRYRKYHHQMQIVITWFEHAAGFGSARTYTALALKTISKQFRCLKDAILGQIRAANKTLGEEEALDGKIEGSRLKYVDNQIRQQRALQQLGMIQHNAWRPQRGLPERSVSVLRAWLFEHFLHPYPKDSDKVMLAKQTGLTRSQVSNWFINARVRLWKPMVEEMYTEEMKENDKNNKNNIGLDDKPGRSKIEDNSAGAMSPTKDPNPNPNLPKQDILLSPNNITSTSPTGAGLQSIPGFNLIGSSEIERLTQGSPKKLRHIDMLQSPPNENDPIPMKFDNDGRQGRDEFTLMGAPANFIGGFGSYPIADLGRFGGAEQFHAPYSGNGGAVSLTLGLPHCENLSISGTHQTFLPDQTMQLGRGVELGETNDFNPMNAGTNPNMYENIDIERRKRFAAATQLLPDFVA